MLADDMLPADTVNHQVMRLLSGVSGQGTRHLAEVETDLAQMNVLLEEAIRKLGASFMAIHGAIGRQQEVLDALLAGKASTAECAPAIAALQGEIALHINSAITGLQFQDMASQLIGGMNRQLTELRCIFGALDAAEAELPPDADLGEMLFKLDAVNRTVAGVVAGQSCPIQKPVSQRHMESGDIELF